MNNIGLQKEIDFAFRRVKRIGDSWGYIPLANLPPGAGLIFTCETTFNSTLEPAVTCLTRGVYKLIMLQWPTVLFDRYKGSVLAVKPYNALMAPGSIFIANYSQYDTTFKLVSGNIQNIHLPDTQYNLSITDRPHLLRKRKKHV